MRIIASFVALLLSVGTAFAACDRSGTCVRLDNGTEAPPPLGSAINVLSFGANGNSSGAGSFDNSTIINNAFSKTIPGSGSLPSVYLPAGTYHVANSINVPPGQCLVGDGWQTIIDVDMDFSPSANGIIVITPTGNARDVKPCLKNLTINEKLPPDISVTASAASAGASSITVSNASGITNGMYVLDITHTAAIPNGLAGTPTTVTGVVGNVVSITPNLVGNVTSGDTIQFAKPRSGFAALGTCNTSVAGGAPCQYPWAVYANGNQNMDIDYLFLPKAYNGIYQRGGTFHFGYIQISAFNVGIDIDNSHNFPQIDDYEFWNFDITPTPGSANLGPATALSNIFYDGSTVAANIGATDGLAAGKFQIWTGIVNFTNNFTWASFDTLMMDGSWTNFNVNNCQWFQIANFYNTKGSNSTGIPINFTPSSGACRGEISNLHGTNSAVGYNFLKVTNGWLHINGGYIWHGIPGASPVDEISQTGGILNLSNLVFDCGSIGTGATYIRNNGGTLYFTNNNFTCPANGGGTVGLTSTDIAGNIVYGNNWNGLTFANPGPLGIYDNYKVTTNAYISSGARPTATGTCSITSQVGGATAGKFTASGACAGGTVILALPTAPTGWHCRASDQSTPTDLMNQTATSTTSATLTGTMANNDIVSFSCIGY